MADSIILNKTASIERCLARIKEDYVGHEAAFMEDQMRQDAIILNLQRACELSIDLANHLAKIHKLGVPKHSREAFELLEGAGFISKSLHANLSAMVGFRNIAVHQYQRLELAVVVAVIEKHLTVFSAFTKIALESV